MGVEWTFEIYPKALVVATAPLHDNRYVSMSFQDTLFSLLVEGKVAGRLQSRLFTNTEKKVE